MTRSQKEIDVLLDQMIEDAEDALDQAFAERLKDILNQISGMYEKYSRRGELTISDLNRFNRFQEEMKQIVEMTDSLYDQVEQMIAILMETTYLENYLRSAFIYEYAAQVEMGFTAPTAAIIQRAIINPIAELTLPAFMEIHRNEIVRNIRIEITQGLLAGEDYSKMAKRIENRVNFSRNKARRVARTEAGRVQSVSRLDAAEVAGKFTKIQKVWSATLDMHTRSTHRHLDGQKADSEGYFHSSGARARAPHLFGIPSQDINCRCSVLFTVGGIMPEVRRSRKDDGKTQVIPYQTYNEWFRGLKSA
ncbi:phage minor head protein [Terribacillus saccharophilus]|uniref:phage minor head protein n=1 Tax=Terribacillus saccharophilus TaxID=361277 RepID=UPI000BA5484C|nr:phage minor head protein [Terribacillus saccharophilus]PAF19745.1 phage head morphogenesis protein [Terribacillus saccharophilus]